MNLTIKARESTQFHNYKQEKDMFVEVLDQIGVDKYGFIYIILHEAIWFCQYHLLKMLSFFGVYFWLLFKRPAICSCTNLCLGLQYESTDGCVCFLFPYHVVLLL